MFRRCFLVLLTLIATGLVPATPVRAQGQYSPELQVGDTVITRYQIDQRARFLTLLGAPGDVRTLAREQLTNEAVQLAAARDQGIDPSPEEIEAGIAEFAARANLSPEQFLQVTSDAGIGSATVRDFFTAGVAWRDTVRARFGEELRAAVTPDQIRRTLAQTGTEGGLRVLISEILLPATTPETTRASQERAAELSALPDEAAFAAAARTFSVAASAPRGGEQNWVALDSLPPEVRNVVAGLTPGRISRPVRLENAIGLFLLRDQERVAPGTPATLSVDYALYLVPGGRTEARQVVQRIDVCDDLYGIAKGQPEERLIRETQPIGALAPDVRAELERLDESETSTALTRGGRATVLMLCARKPALESNVDQTIIGNRLLNARLGSAAAHYLAELRADTDVTDLTAN